MAPVQQLEVVGRWYVQHAAIRHWYSLLCNYIVFPFFNCFCPFRFHSFVCLFVCLFLIWYPRREAGDVWCLPHVWNLRLSFDSTLLPPLLFFRLVLWLFLSDLFSAFWPILLNFFQKILQYFSLRSRLFCNGSCLAARRRKLVGDMCRMLPYGTGIWCYAFIYIYIFYCFCSFPFYT